MASDEERNIERADFYCAYISYDGDEPELIVSGEVTSGGGTVELSPMVYVTQPEYWEVEVLWDRTNALFQVITPYEVSIPLSAIRGTKGFSVLGERMTKTFERS